MRAFVNAVRRNAILTAVFVFALAASVAAAQQPGGGGARSGVGRLRAQSGSRPHFDGPRGQFDGPRGQVIVGSRLHDPFRGPFYSQGFGYPYGYGNPYGYWAYDSFDITGDVKTKITPKQTQVYVDGYYAGVADDFDGVFQGLYSSPGGHSVTLHLEGYRTITRNIYVRPYSTYKLRETMEKLAPGEVSEPVLLTGRSDGTMPTPHGGSARQR